MRMRTQVLSITVSGTIPDNGIWIARDGHGQVVARISGGSITAVLAWAAAYDEQQRRKFFLANDSSSFPFPEEPTRMKPREDQGYDAEGYTWGGGSG